MRDLIVTPYEPDQLDASVEVLANAFVTNPLHVAALGAGELDLNRLLFRIGVQHLFTGTAFVAVENGEVRGFMHFGRSPTCLGTEEQVHAASVTLLKPLGSAVPRIVEWLVTWCRLDPAPTHFHLGPIGVSPKAQGTGVGSALMARFVELLEQESAPGYLETDRPENVKFYERFGFEVRHEQPLLGVPTWYMWRAASSPAA